VWQFNLSSDFQMAISNSPKTIFPTQTAIFNGTVTALNGFTSSVRLRCTAGASGPPSLCTPSPLVLTPTTNTQFTITAGGIVGDYDFNVQGVGSDTNGTTHQVGLTLHVINFGVTTPSPTTVTAAPGTTSSPASFQVTALGSFNQAVTVSCTVNISGGGCNLTPGTTVNPTSTAPVNMTASIVVPLGTAAGSYTASIQAKTSGAPSPLNTSFTVNVSTTADFVLTEPLPFPTVNAGSTTTSGSITVSSINGFSGAVVLSCSLISGSGSCSVSPASVNSFPAGANVTVNTATLAAGSYQLSVQGTSGTTTHTLVVPFNVGDYRLSGTQSLTIGPGAQGTANLIITPTTFYSGRINATCDASSVRGAICTLNSANPITVNKTAVSLIATITVPANAAAGIYSISINTQDTTGAPSHNLPITLTISQDFSIMSSTASQTVAPGQTSSPYSLTIQPAGASFNSAVTLSCPSGLPSGAQCNFTPNPVTPGSSAAAVAMTVSTSTTTSVGTYTVGVTGVSGLLSHSLTAALIVAGTDFTMAVTPSLGSVIDAGAQTTATVTITPTSTRSIQVNTTCDATALAGMICTINRPNLTVTPGTPVNLTATINLPNTAVPGTYSIGLNVQEVGGPIIGGLFPVTVIQDFSVNAATHSQTVAPGQTTGAYQLTVAPAPTSSSFSGAVTLSCSSGLPAGAQCIFSPSTPITMTASSSAAVVMSISTPTTARLQRPRDRNPVFLAMWLALPGIVVVCGTVGASRRQRGTLGAIAVILGLLLTSCGGGTSVAGGGGGSGHQPTKYTVTISGVSGSLTHTTTVDLMVTH
jgi:uncharacterized membrane protein